MRLSGPDIGGMSSSSNFNFKWFQYLTYADDWHDVTGIAGNMALTA